MRVHIYSVALLAAAVAAAGFPTAAEARTPYHGDFEGNMTRTIPTAKPKKKKLKATAQTVQTGDAYDARTTVQASGGGEKVSVVLDFTSDDSLTVKINGQAFSGNLRPNKGRVPVAAKKIRFKGTAKGTANFVGPLKQNLSADGSVNGAKTTFSGFIDLTASDVLALQLNLKSTSASRLGAKSGIRLDAKRK